jgi:hypothetical protein
MKKTIEERVSSPSVFGLPAGRTPAAEAFWELRPPLWEALDKHRQPVPAAEHRVPCRPTDKLWVWSSVLQLYVWWFDASGFGLLVHHSTPPASGYAGFGSPSGAYGTGR